MGLLSQSAEKTFNKTRRRAYVPDWWRPLSYVAGGAAVAFLLFSGVLAGGDSDNADATADGADTIVIDTPADTVVDTPTSAAPTPVPSSNTPSSSPSSSASSNAGSGSIDIPTLAGTTVSVPVLAAQTATNAAQALFSGDFSQVPVVAGQSPPTVSSPLAAAAASTPSSVTIAPSGATMTFRIPVYPDGNTAGTTAREVTVTVQLVDDQWQYVPLASG